MASVSTSVNLWQKAAESLPSDVQSRLDFGAVNGKDIPSKILEDAIQERDKCIRKRLKFRRSDGKSIILRDVFEKIVLWVEKFIAIGDVAAQYDPLHAAPVWAAFRFVLQLCINHQKTNGEMIQHLETVSRLITRYAFLEDIYLQNSSTLVEQFKALAIRLYANMLIFLSSAKKYFESSNLERFKTALRPPGNNEVAEILALDNEISKIVDLFGTSLQVQASKQAECINALFMSLNGPLKRLADNSYISMQTLQQKEHVELLRWLSDVPYIKHHTRHSQTRLAGTGDWLLKNEKYLAWHQSSSSDIFLLRGVMGCGKTYLTSTVIDSFMEQSQADPLSAPFAYFYCSKNPAEPERSDSEEIMRSIVRQFTVVPFKNPVVQSRIVTEHRRRQEVAQLDGFDPPKLGISECRDMILEITAQNPALIVIDAVDEIQPSKRYSLIYLLKEIIDSSSSVVKIFISSRSDSSTDNLLSVCPRISVEPRSSQADIEIFIRSELRQVIKTCRLLDGDVSNKLEHDLIKALTSGAGEMFIWAARQIEHLCCLKTEADIRSAMGSLPSQTLNDLYGSDYDRLMASGPNASKQVIDAFSLLLAARESLSMNAFIQALDALTPPGEAPMTLQKILSLCSNLVIVDTQTKTVQFAHVSFQEFLEIKADFNTVKIHKVVGLSCLSYCLEAETLGAGNEFSPGNNFKHYSILYWADHCGSAGDTYEDTDMNNELLEFVFDDKRTGDVSLSFSAWIEDIRVISQNLPLNHKLLKKLNSLVASNHSPLFTASNFGLLQIINVISLKQDFDWNQKSDTGQSALYLAACAGNIAIVRSVLQHFVDVNCHGGKYGHPIHAAAYHGYHEIVQCLLDHNADPMLGPSKSALELSILGGHENIAILLLKNKNCSISTSDNFNFIWRRSAEFGFVEVTQFLQSRYPEFYGAAIPTRRKALQTAILKGRLSLVERHIAKSGAIHEDIPEDSISIAALGGQNEMIKFLVHIGLEVNQEGPYGTPIRAASIMGHESTVRYLIDLGADISAAGEVGQPLQAAAIGGHDLIIRMLLDQGADVNAKGGIYGTALQAAASRGHLRAAEILLKAGANMRYSGLSRDALHAASEAGHADIVQLFLNEGFVFEHPTVSIGRSMASSYLLPPGDVLHRIMNHERDSNLQSE